MSILKEVQDAWGWTGIKPVELVDENDFGNLIIKDVHRQCWRLCPEDCYCEVVAPDQAAFEVLAADSEFLVDWQMSVLKDQATQQLGALSAGRKFCLKIPGILGGEYGGDNLGTISLEELIRVSGDLAHQIASLPDGTTVKLSVID
ncbi:T6SS immunity protein Tdi1 domain-containing protein [Ralstonia sp. R-29]|uniref:T6SS immunity protein Tdi1 domain-containing protein n=1 Tax=Ralstonia sp. R-29 TaxID=3404059 RepID=UPI003CF86C7A